MPAQMKVRDLMTTDVVTLTEDKYGCLAVVGRDDTLPGVVTGPDFLRLTVRRFP